MANTDALMRYAVLDLATANANQASICQIGIVIVENGHIVERVMEFVDPEDSFDPLNIAIHGIRPDDVKGKPQFPEILTEIDEYCREGPGKITPLRSA